MNSVVVVAGLANVLGGKHRATLPASAGVALLDLHPVGLVVLVALTLAANVTVANVGGDNVGVLHGAVALENGVLHVKDIHTLHLTQELESFQTSGLILVGGDGAGLSTGTKQVLGARHVRQLGRGTRGGFELGLREDNSGHAQTSGLPGGTNECTRKPAVSTGDARI